MATSIFQTGEWEQFKLETGWQKSYWLDDILVLQKSLPFGRTMLYSPQVSENQKLKVESSKFITDVSTIAHDCKAIFYRLELDVPVDSMHGLKIENSNLKIGEAEFRKAFEEMQPEHTLILDISQSEEDILAQMKQKGRYNIKIGERSDITLNSSEKPGSELDDFYQLYETMAKRQKISYRNKKYFETLLDILGQKGYGKVYSASVGIGGKRIPLAAAIVSFFGTRATYLFGGSSNEHRNLMAPYRLHWAVIKEAQEQGCTEYDFFGIAPNDDQDHPWAGVTRFKKQFGGRQIQLLGSYDLIFKPMEYQMFKIAEQIRR